MSKTDNEKTLPIDPKPAELALQRLMREAEKLAGEQAEDTLAALERLAKGIQTYLKTLDDIATYNARCGPNEDDTKPFSYENLPPPSPEDYDRLIEKLHTLMAEDAKPAPLRRIRKTAAKKT